MEKRSFRAGAHTIASRVLAGTLFAVSRASLPAVIVFIMTAEGPVPLPVLVRVVLTFSLVPALAAWLVRRAAAAEVHIDASEISVDRRDVQVAVPRASIAAVTPWWIPLPGPGVSLRLRSGRRFPLALETSDPVLLDALDETGGVRDYPIVVWARARGERRARWYHPIAKFLGFGLLPAAIMFNLDQHVTYGGLFGQYYLEGPWRWFRSFAGYWTLASIYLLLYAAVWRGVAESVTLLAAAVAPSQVARVRRAVEVVCRVVYYAGVPVMLAVPFLR